MKGTTGLAAAYPLSPTQQGLLFHALLAPGQPLYFEQRWCVIDGPLDRARFRAAWQQVLDAHEALRSRFTWPEGGAPEQQAVEGLMLPWRDLDWHTQPEADAAAAFSAWLAADRAQGFDPAQAPLMRCALIQLGPRQHRFVWSYHHLLMDGWSNARVIAEVLARYVQPDRPLPAPRPYREHVAWLQRQDRPAAQAHWRQALAVAPGVTVPTPLPWLRAAAEAGAAAGSDEQSLPLDPARSAALQASARQARLTLNTLVQGAWALLLARASGQATVLFGATVAGRPPELADAEQRVGLYIHTVPLPVAVPPQAAPGPWLQALQQQFRGHEQQAHLGLAEIQRCSAVPGGSPLFDSVLVFENYPLSSAAALAGVGADLRLSDIGGHERTHYPLALMVLPGETLTLQLRHDAARLPAAAAARLLRQLAALLLGLQRALDGDPSLQQLRALSPSDADEQAALALAARGSQAPDRAMSTPVLLPALLAAQAAARPAQDALRRVSAESDRDGPGGSGVDVVSYAELEARATRLAARLQAAGVRRGARIGVCLPRGTALGVALLAVWKAGAAYVPLDPGHPAARRALVLQRGGLALLIAEGAGVEEATDADESTPLTIPVLDVADPGGPVPAWQPVPLIPADPAYVMFTSGSTGVPKGVAVSHGALLNLLQGMAVAPGLGPDDNLLALTTVAFDIAGLEIWGPLMQGGRVLLASADLARDPSRLMAALDTMPVQVMQATPATWQLLRDAGWRGQPGLRAWVGGEALDPGLAAWLLPRCAALWNLYGPTETTIWSTALRVTPGLLAGLAAGDSLPIGGPTQATTLDVLDAWGESAGIGLPGELLIGGAGVAEGYVEQPALSADRFVPDPRAESVAGQAGARRYRTGDLVRWREDGALDFLGRSDHQIKLRGHRIELGEIESLLLQQPGVLQAVVLLRSDAPAGPELQACLRLDTALHVDADAAITPLRTALQQRLPAYMLPAFWRCLPELPLTPNGKVDRQALAAAPLAAATAPASAADTDPLQALVAGVWAQVLGRTPAAQDHFFEVGGHSIAATRVATRLQALRPQAGAVPLRLLFEHPRLEDYVEALRRQAGGAVWPPVLRLTDPEAGDDGTGGVPLLPAQQRQWLMAQFAPDSRAYTIALQLQIDGVLDEAALALALQALVDRHEALRTTIHSHEGRPRAQVQRQAPLDLQVFDGAQPQAVADWLAQPFDLRQAPLLRAALCRGNVNVDAAAGAPQRLLLAIHHVAADDASIGVLARELAADYAALRQHGAAAALQPTPALRPRDVAAWQRGLDLAAARAHWQAALHELPLPQPLHLQANSAAPGAAVTVTAGQHRQPLDAALMQQVQALAQAQGVTPYMLLLAAFALLLQRHGAGDDLVIGSPVAGRPRSGQPELEGLVGMFVNTLPLRLRVQGHHSAAALLAQVRQVALAAWDHQDLAVDDMQALLPPARAAAPLFDTVFSLQNAHGALPAAEAGGVRWQPLPLAPLAAKFGLSLALRPALPGEPGGDSGTADGAWLAAWEYDRSRFSDGVVQRLARHWRVLLQQLLAQPQQALQSFSPLDAQEAAQLAAWSRPMAPAPRPTGSLWTAFAQQAARHATRTALIDGDQRWTYAQLQAAAEAQAAALRAAGHRRGDWVALWGRRSAAAVIGLLGVLRAGGVYVPLDPQAPAERLATLVQQAGLRWLVAGVAEGVDRSGLQTLQAVPAADDAALPPWPGDEAQAAEHLAYVMHTSGSTGGPKAVGTPQRGVLRLVQQVDYVALGPEQVLLQAAPLAFDASTFEIWGALLHGATLVIAPDNDLDALATLIQRHRVSTLWLTAGLMHLLVDERLPALAGVQQLLAGGDVLSPPHVARLLAAHPQLRLINGYGPTETTTFACCHTVTAADAAGGRIPIGRPIAHTRVAVVDDAGQQQPVGLPGELLIGGDGVAHGYLGRPALTAAAFVPDPDCDLEQAEAGDAGQVLYRSGDRVRWRDDGVLEFLGRVDRQFKLRGHRIEPGEIEARLLAHEAIADAVVQLLPGPGGTPRLGAWLVAVAEPLAPDRLRAWVAQALPAAAVPGTWVWLPRLPLTPNGKVDRAALLLPAGGADGTADADAAVPDDIEPGSVAAQLLALWRALLPGPAAPAGLHDNFFDLGGDSIVAMQLASRAQALGLALSPAQVFEHQTVAALAAALTAAGASPLSTVADAAPEAAGPLALTPIQRWFFGHGHAQPAHFNQAVCLQLPAAVSIDALQAALDAVLPRHDALRLRFEHGAQGWQARLADGLAPTVIEHCDLAAVPADAQQAAWLARGEALQASLDLQQGPLHRVLLADLGPRGQRLLVVMHHLVVDGVSWRVLLAEWQQALLQQGLGQPPRLGPRPPGPRAWADWLAGQRAAAQAAAPWWRAQTMAAQTAPATGQAHAEVPHVPQGPPGLPASQSAPLASDTSPASLWSLPFDGPEPDAPAWQADAQTLRLDLPAADTAALLACAGAEGPMPLLLTALLRALAPWTGRPEQGLALESHGRDGADAFASSVGWFTAWFPLRLTLGDDPAAAAQWQQLCRQWADLAAQGQGRGWGLLADALHPPPPLALVFNFLGELPRLQAAGAGDGWRREAVPGALSAAGNRRAQPLELNAWVDDGRLTLSLAYGRRQLQATSAQALLQRLADELQALPAALQDKVAAAAQPMHPASVADEALAAALAQVSFGD